MFDALLAYAIVAVAAAFVLWRVVLPSRARAALKRAGGGAACGTEDAGACGGCSGCPAAKPARRS
jgi:hypothetical protein